MTNSQRRIERGSLFRLSLEFVVIVTSILAAFGLEAWWNQRVEDVQTRARLEVLHEEFVASRAQLDRESEHLESARRALVGLLNHISPTAPLVSLDSLTVLMDLSFRHATVEVQTGSLQALLASGQLAAIDHVELTGLLAAWPAAVADVRRKTQMVEDNRELIINYLHDRIPVLQIAEKTGQMERYPGSSFTASPAVVQRDMKMEGLFGNRGILLEDADVRLLTLSERAGRILDLIQGVLSGEQGGRNSR